MKKLLCVLLVMFMAGSVFAAQTRNEIIDETLSITTSAYEAEIYISDSRRVSFFTTIDNARTTARVTATVTAAISLDGTNWQDISWMDTAGGVTPQTTETTTAAEQTYVGWMDDRLIGKFLRIRVNSTELGLNTAGLVAGDNAAISVTVVQDK